ncbi:sugar transporter SWEET1 [Pararge aegeria]|uniref:Sugar transporter SWEET n=2 Tax=Pararge aegeria TaxID=116150 RepID=A0A8S4R3S6_9NEOP|nr:sugar transporter SWEET1 [Pararge aegeria]CAH2230193.1 jg20670 [Pararge aegeria aegeria]
MNLVGIRELVSFSAVVTTILQFLSGILVCKQYVVNRTTAESSPLPFICGFLSCGVWLLYGLIKQDNIVTFVNVVGILLMISYVFVFYNYTFKKTSLSKQFLVSLVFYMFIMGYVSVETDNELLLRRVGLSACILTMLAIAAPMSKLLYVIRTKCTECLPFPMIVMSFIVSSLWFFYGLIEEDVYMMIPNSIGCGLTAVQLCLFMIYPATPYSSLPTKTTLA